MSNSFEGKQPLTIPLEDWPEGALCAAADADGTVTFLGFACNDAHQLWFDDVTQQPAPIDMDGIDWHETLTLNPKLKRSIFPSHHAGDFLGNRKR